MTVRADLIRIVEARAAERCEYCRMHQCLQGATFHMEHVLPSSRGGDFRLDNLAWACPGCNLRKSDRIDAIDPDSHEIVSLFNPRVHTWDAHFQFDGYYIRGVTPTARATVEALELNHPRRILIRQAEEWLGLFPP